MGMFRHSFRYDLGTAVVGGGACALFAVAVRLFSASPYYVWQMMSAVCSLPPLWLSSVLWLAVQFLVGAMLGCILSGSEGGAAKSCVRYRAGIYLVLSLTAGLMWYPLLFGARALVFSLLLMAAACVLTMLCGLLLWREDGLLALVSFVVTAWYAAVFLCQLNAIFCI
ncbi:MAG: hypothetical protein E7589_00110 [Ruminococcaceae bacterium]|nr:hypothetical protein [Oscillospiraceae bacterium]